VYLRTVWGRGLPLLAGWRGLAVIPGRSLFRRAALTVATGLVVFQVAASIAIYANVLRPLAQRSASDFAAFLVLSRRTWVELPPGTRPAFAAELAESHRVDMSETPDRASRTSGIIRTMNLLRER